MTDLAVAFKKAEKKAAKVRLALIGPAGAGKTYTALSVASSLGSRIAVVDTEHGSASKYADRFDFDTLELESFDPRRYIEAIDAAVAAGYEVLVIDSLSHAWSGKDGALEMVDRAAAQSRSGNSYVAWRNVTPLHNRLVESMLSAKLHVIVTMRSKTEYILESGKDGKMTPRKVGMAPIQREGVDFEFDIVGELDTTNTLHVSKTRCSALNGKSFHQAGAEFASEIAAWLDGVAPGRGEAEEQGTVREAASPVSSADEAGELRKVWWKLAQELGADADTFKDYFATRYPMYESTHDLSVEELEAEIAFLSAVNDPWAKFIETIKPEVFTQEGSPEGSGASTGDLSDTDKGRYRRKLYAIGRKLGHDSEGVKELLKASKLIESSTDELDEAGWKAAIAAFETKAKEAESA